jgi:hypothetical protein
MAALDRGWIPKGSLNDPKITNACHNEDLGEFRCIVRHGQQEAAVQKSMIECLDGERKDSTHVIDLSGSELLDEATKVFNEYWAAHRIGGTTCDFGGVAQLVELNRTITDDDKAYSYDDDEYVVVYRGPAYWLIGVSVFLAIVVGVMLGFVVAMRVSKRFNKSVRESTFFTPLTRSTNPHIRSSLFLSEMSNEFAELTSNDHGKQNYGS